MLKPPRVCKLHFLHDSYFNKAIYDYIPYIKNNQVWILQLHLLSVVLSATVKKQINIILLQFSLFAVHVLASRAFGSPNAPFCLILHTQNQAKRLLVGDSPNPLNAQSAFTKPAFGGLRRLISSAYNSCVLL